MISVSFLFSVTPSFLEKRSQHPITIARRSLGYAYDTVQSSGFAKATEPGQIRVIFPHGDTGTAHIYSNENNRGPYLQFKFDGDFPRIPAYFKKGDELLVAFTEVITSGGPKYYAILELFEN